MTLENKQVAVFTDMDGTLLDHYTYDFTPARGLLLELKTRRIPVIPSTSKSCAEMDVLCAQMELEDGYAAENGAVACLPSAMIVATEMQPATTKTMSIQSFAQSASHWQNLVTNVREGFSCRLFSDCSPADVSAMTGLDEASAARALDRQFSEVVDWQDSEENLSIFRQRLHDSGAFTMRGGRFLHVTGDIDKGCTMHWIARKYAEQSGVQPTTIAAGDSENDIPMLASADIAVVVRSPVHAAPSWDDSLSPPGQKIIITDTTGPTGWKDGMILAVEHLGIKL